MRAHSPEMPPQGMIGQRNERYKRYKSPPRAPDRRSFADRLPIGDGDKRDDISAYALQIG
jgi:hypothetical protein